MSKQRRDIQLIKEIAERLKNLREVKGYTQERVTDDTKMNIGKIELGTTSLLLTSMSILCKYYEITLEELFRDL